MVACSLPLEEVVQALNERPHQQTVIIAGRGCHQDILGLPWIR